MKKLRLLLLLILPAIFFACEEDDSPAIQPVSFDVTVKYSSAYANQAAANVTVKALNVDSKITTEVATNAAGIARFENLPVGIYDISVSQTYSPAQFLDFAGQTVGNDVVFNATLTNQTINITSARNFELELKSSPIGSLLLKQIYYAGSHTRDGASFRDQFIEIYNNSDQVQYADGLCFAQLLGNNSSTIANPRPAYLLENGQFDWSKSIGMPSNLNANADYVYTKSLLQIPGSGTQYPIEPGQSILIAQNALNHKAPYTNQAGTVITPNDPGLTVDLSNANFEAFYNEGFNSDIDNPAVPNLTLIQYFGNDMLLDNPGRDAYVLIRKESGIASLPKYPAPDKTSVTSTTTLHYQVPKAWVLDAVEIQQSPTKLIPKKLTDELDAGYTFVPSGSYSSQSVIRKVNKTIGGRNILQDTNNSTNDFRVLDRANPKGF
ncbi:MAG: DUF4876 domain-containing protein [Rufibacter sp.]